MTTVIGIIALSILIYYWLYNKIKIKLPFFQKEIELGGHIFESKVYTTSKGRVFAVPTSTRAKSSEKKDNMVTQKLVQDNEQDLQLLLGTKQLPGQ